MDKREQIERALGRFVSQGWREEFALKGWEFYQKDFLDALADQAIVIECEVEHIGAEKDPDGFTHIERCDQPIDGFLLTGKYGTPGKALAIIVSLENDEDTQQS